jgi:hypothetical protein
LIIIYNSFFFILIDKLTMGKRYQVSNACKRCHKIHMSCDEIKPCSRCKEKGYICELYHRKKRQKKISKNIGVGDFRFAKTKQSFAPLKIIDKKQNKKIIDKKQKKILINNKIIKRIKSRKFSLNLNINDILYLVNIQQKYSNYKIILDDNLDDDIDYDLYDNLNYNLYSKLDKDIYKLLYN